MKIRRAMEQKKEPQIVLIKKGSGSPPATVTNLGGRSLKTGLANYVDGARTYESILVKGEHVFVFFEDQNFWTANLLDKNNRSIIPSRPHCKFADLPDTFSLKTKEELYELVFKEVEDYCGLKPALCHLISAFVILSYTQDFFNVLPILNLYGTTRSGKTACFILIRELAYRSVLETNMTAANILEHCNKGRTADNQYTSCGTILEDEVDSIDTEKLHVLKSDSKWHSQSRILNKNGTRVQNTAQSFGLKLLAGEHLAGDEALQRRCISLRITSSRPVKNIYDINEADKIRFNAIRGELLSWKLSSPGDFDYSAENIEFGEFKNYWRPLLVAASGTNGFKPILEFFQKMYLAKKQSKLFSIEGDIAAVIRSFGISSLPGLPFATFWEAFVAEAQGEPKNSNRSIILPEGEELSKSRVSKILRTEFGITTEVGVSNGKVYKVLAFDREELLDILKKYTV